MDSPTSSTFKLTLNEDNVNLDNSYHTNQQKKITKIEKKRKKERVYCYRTNNLCISFLTSEYDSNIMITSTLHHLI